MDRRPCCIVETNRESIKKQSTLTEMQLPFCMAHQRACAQVLVDTELGNCLRKGKRTVVAVLHTRTGRPALHLRGPPKVLLQVSRAVNDFLRQLVSSPLEDV